MTTEIFCKETGQNTHINECSGCYYNNVTTQKGLWKFDCLYKPMNSGFHIINLDKNITKRGKI